MDAVYIIGDLSPWSDNETKYSLRSLEKHVSGIDDVYIVGHKPVFINDSVIHIPAKDLTFNRAKNIATKILLACADENLSENFLLMNDDYFFLQDADVKSYPYHYNGSLRDVKAHSNFIHHVKATIRALEGNNKPILNYDCHYPIVVNKHLFPMAHNQYSWNKEHGYTVKSMYCNTIGIPFCKTKRAEDSKLRFTGDVIKASQFIRNKSLFSTCEAFQGDECENFMNGLYPERSRYEY